MEGYSLRVLLEDCKTRVSYASMLSGGESPVGPRVTRFLCVAIGGHVRCHTVISVIRFAQYEILSHCLCIEPSSAACVRFATPMRAKQ